MKHYMSEDAVSTCLQRLSLENDHSYGGNGLPRMSPLEEPQNAGVSSSDSSSENENVVVDPGEFLMSSCEVISVCPLLEETLRGPWPDSIAPESLLHSLSSPCLDLVVWSPPSGPIHQLLRSLAVGDNKRRKNGRDMEEGMEL